mmetsp:Transcript_4090/g.10341  ORF Transcript_4090/g.10341 Transcript_4090/m.10341 type:complete len:643 (+) Transcript_4090:263-2191(+)
MEGRREEGGGGREEGKEAGEPHKRGVPQAECLVAAAGRGRRAASDPRDGDAGRGEKPDLVPRHGLLRLQARHHDDLLVAFALHHADGAQLAVGGVAAPLRAAAAGQQLVVPRVLPEALLSLGLLVPEQVQRRWMDVPLVDRHQQHEEQLVRGSAGDLLGRRLLRVVRLLLHAGGRRPWLEDVVLPRGLLPGVLDLELRVAVPRQPRGARHGAAAAHEDGVRLDWSPLDVLLGDQLPGQPLRRPDLHDLHGPARLHEKPEATLLAHRHGRHDEHGLQLLRVDVHLERAVRDVLLRARGREHVEAWHQLRAAAREGHLLLVLHGVDLQRGGLRAVPHDVDGHLDAAAGRVLAARRPRVLPLLVHWADEEVRVLAPGLRAEGAAPVPPEVSDHGGAPSPPALQVWQVVLEPVLAAPLPGRLQRHAAVPVRQGHLVAALDAGGAEVLGYELELPLPQLGVDGGEQVLLHERLPRVPQRDLQVLHRALQPDLGHPLLGVEPQIGLDLEQLLELVGGAQHSVLHAAQRGLLRGETRLLELARAGRDHLGGSPPVGQRRLGVAHRKLEGLLRGQGEVHLVDLRERVRGEWRLQALGLCRCVLQPQEPALHVELHDVVGLRQREEELQLCGGVLPELRVAILQVAEPSVD